LDKETPEKWRAIMKKRIVFLTLIFLVLLSYIAFSQDAQTSTRDAQTASKSVWNVIFDNAVSITILFVFLSAIVGAILRSRAIDKCLKYFDDFYITLELMNQEVMWGTLNIYSTGLELVYREPYSGSGGHVETSYILYASEYDKIQALYRYHGDLTAQGREKREKDIRKTYQPSVFWKAFRWLRNLLNTFKDALSQTLSLIIGQMKKISPGSVIFAQDTQLSRIGTEIIGYAGNAYDPILERYIGKKVVVEITYPTGKEQHLGILKEYTPTFMELLNVSYPFTLTLPMKGNDTNPIKITGISRTKQDDVYAIANRSVNPVMVTELRKGEETLPMHLEIEPGNQAEVCHDDPDMKEITATITTTRVVDIIVPRSRALIRHAGPREKVGWKELLGLDDVEYFFGKFRKE
jgi:hypothetical protein